MILKSLKILYKEGRNTMKKLTTLIISSIICLTSIMSSQTVFAEEPEEPGTETVTIDVSDLNDVGEGGVEESKFQYIVSVTSGNLNVRDYPVTGKVIGSLPKGTIVNVPYMSPKGTVSVRGWAWINSPMEGYVCVDYLSDGGAIQN